MKLCFRRRAMAPDDCHRPLIAKAGVRFQVRPSEICGKQSGTGTGFSWSTSVFSCQYHATNAPQWSSSTRCFYQSDKRAKPKNLPKMLFGNRGAPDRKGISSFFYALKSLRLLLVILDKLRSVSNVMLTVHNKSASKMIQRSDPRSTYHQFWNMPYHRPNLWWPFVIIFLSYSTGYRLFGAAPSLNNWRTTCNREFFTNRTQLHSEVAGNPILYSEDRGFECRNKRAAILTGSSLLSSGLAPCQEASPSSHISVAYELFYQLNAIEYLLCTFSSTCFGLTRPSSGAMDVTISLHIQHMVSLV